MTGLPGWLGTIAIIAGAVAVAFTAFTSKYQKRLTQDRERYIAHLEGKNERQAAVNKEQGEKLARLEERLKVVEDLLLGRCPYFAINDATGGCEHCNRCLRYGQKTEGKEPRQGGNPP